MLCAALRWSEGIDRGCMLRVGLSTLRSVLPSRGAALTKCNMLQALQPEPVCASRKLPSDHPRPATRAAWAAGSPMAASGMHRQGVGHVVVAKTSAVYASDALSHCVHHATFTNVCIFGYPGLGGSRHTGQHMAGELPAFFCIATSPAMPSHWTFTTTASQAAIQILAHSSSLIRLPCGRVPSLCRWRLRWGWASRCASWCPSQPGSRCRRGRCCPSLCRPSWVRPGPTVRSSVQCTACRGRPHDEQQHLC
jgi:hypothetical protein